MLASEIELVVGTLLELKKKLPKEEIDKYADFLEFRNTQKMLYETVLSNDFSPEIFKVMMDHKRKIESGADQYSVDVSFGQIMADRYIPESLKKC